ncbi:LacI family transcriptional regulator [Sphaerotilus hippei]|uniref:LacI family transcriptional regulator n=1 Tax=Sphaerotilus hippei TaxID=744406 RepID=A0A318GWI9_9BURK|nr:LacI family DNA-binding transcriptional regulator [Sphaerotilus hippei]PXW93984.1 LacI family transcriptional regulator [Sphaerotilus hippei]
MSDASSRPPGPPRRKRSARFIEIAAAAGVSTATVNRVLNERGSVSAATRARVVAAAKQLGVPRLLPDPRHGLTRFDVVLADSPTPYFRRLDRALQRSAQTLDPRILIHRHHVDADDVARVQAALTRPGHRRDGLIVALHDSEVVREALRSQIERGVPVATLMSGIGDVPGLHYAGIDNHHAGRTAGHFIGRLARGPGRVLLLTNSLDYRAHVERMQGATEVLAERHPQLACSAPVTCLDDPDRCQIELRQALAQAQRDQVPLVGLYHSGAGSAGIAAVLQRLTPAHRPVWIGHEISDEHRNLVRLGLMDLVIDQDPDGQVATSLHHLLHATGYVEQPAPGEPNEFRLFCAENLGRHAYLDHEAGA